MTWRIVLTRYDRSERVVNVADVAQLRVVLDRARADPDITGWRYRRLPELAGEVRTACPRCGKLYRPGKVQERECRCGLIHVEHHCSACRTGFADPPYLDGCGPVPVDTEGINARYRRQHRRPAG